MTKSIFFTLLISLMLFSFVFAVSVLAASPTPAPSPAASPAASPSGSPPAPGGVGGAGTSGGSTVDLSQLSPVSETDPAVIIGNVIKAVLGTIGAFALFMFVYGGMLLLTSAGNQEKIKRGKDVIIWAVIGVMVILGSYVLVDFVITGIEGGT